MQILVIVAAGDQTIHESWITKSDETILESKLDFAVIWYSDNPIPKSIILSSKYLFQKKGSKWELIKFVLKEINWHIYDYIWMPDDDLYCKSGSIQLFCNIMKENKLCLAQPSLTEQNVQWKILIKDPTTIFRLTNFIEIQAPCFQVNILDPDIKTGWGLDFVWASILKKFPKGVIDVVQMEHTRSSKKQSIDYQGGGTNPFDELFSTLKKYKVKKFKPTIIQCISYTNIQLIE